MNDVFDRIWEVMESDPGKRGLTTDLPRADLRELGFSLLDAGEVFVISGFPVQRAGGKGETDGPIGCANIAAVLEQLGKKVTVVTDEPSCAAMLAVCSLYAPKAEVLCVPKNGAQAFCYTLIKHRKPTHVIAIERPGRGKDGHFHNFRGEYIDDLIADTDLLLYDKSVVTIGIGDGGNELGMGALRGVIEERVNLGTDICADAPADFTLTAGVSNWWGWGLRAVMSAVSGRDLMPCEEEERKLLRAVICNGCVDGVSGLPEMTVDNLSLEENLRILTELRQVLQLPDFAHMEPAAVRRLFRENRISRTTAGMCAGYAQCNLVVLPSRDAAEFREFARRNPFACPVLEESRVGARTLEQIAKDIDLARDFPRYRVWRDGRLVAEPFDVADLWNDDLVAFLIGCSFSFEDALMQAGLPMRHIEQGCNVPMYRTNIKCEPYGQFSGHMVVSMRPMTPEQAELARQITANMPRVHGAPVEIGQPERIGIHDLQHPDFGDMVEIREGEIPVFWPCGVTPQAVLMNACPAFAITHAPGYMLLTDVKNADLMDEKVQKTLEK